MAKNNFKNFFEKCWQKEKGMLKYKSFYTNSRTKKVHWKVNNESFREKTKRYSLEIKKYQKVNQKKIKKLKFIKKSLKKLKIILRVWSWLRINAGGAHKTCKSNGSRYKKDWRFIWLRFYNNGFSGGLVSNAWATCLLEGNNSEKSLLIPHMPWTSHDENGKRVIC